MLAPRLEEASARLNSVEERSGQAGWPDRRDEGAGPERDSQADEQRIKASVEDERNKILAAADQDIAAATSQAQRQFAAVRG